MSGSGGRLYLVGTPIGNLEDMTPRASRVLAGADVIYCEDTRRTRKLLSALAVPAPRLVRLDRHNEAEMAGRVVAAVAEGSTAVLVSDAGMPGISDPGARIVAAVAGAGYPCEVVPGPSAVSTALAVSGLPASQYRFCGFLARKGRDRVQAIGQVAAEAHTAVIYEAANRVARTVTDLAAACGPDRPFVAARELTKLHEEVWRGTLGGAVEWLAARTEEPRGEWVLMVGPSAGPPGAGGDGDDPTAAIAEALEAMLDAGLDRRRAVAEVAAQLSVPKRQVYDVAVAIKAR